MQNAVLGEIEQGGCFFLPPKKSKKFSSRLSLMKRKGIKRNCRSNRIQIRTEELQSRGFVWRKNSQDGINLWHQEEPRQGNERQTPRIGPTELRSDPKAARRDCAYLGRGQDKEGALSRSRRKPNQPIDLREKSQAARASGGSSAIKLDERGEATLSCLSLSRV